MVITDPVVLDAVNSILSAINEDGVNSLVDLEDTDAINALNMLNSTNRSFQSRGWSFNTFEDYPLNPDALSDKIKWPDNILSIVPSDNYKGLIKRNGYVYDTSTASYPSSTIRVTVVMLMDFSNIPVTAQDYVIAKASSRFSNRYLGDDSLSTMLNRREQEAWLYFNEQEHITSPVNMLENTYISGVKQR